MMIALPIRTRQFLSMVLVGMLTLPACSQLQLKDSGSQKDSPKLVSAMVGEINTALVAIRKLEADIGRGLLLAQSTDDQRARLEDLIYGIKASLYLLRKSPDSTPAARQLQAKYDEMATTDFVGQDRSRFEELLDQVAKILNQLTVGNDGEDDGHGEDNSAEETTLLAADFEADLGAFSNYSTDAAFDWHHKERQGVKYARISGHPKPPATVWLLSPPVDLTGVEQPALSFEQSVGFLDDWNLLKVKVSTNFSGGDPTAAAGIEWQELTVENKPAFEPYYEWVNSGAISLAAFAGEKITIAFEYTSTAAQKPTWQIDNVKITGKK